MRLDGDPPCSYLVIFTRLQRDLLQPCRINTDFAPDSQSGAGKECRILQTNYGLGNRAALVPRLALSGLNPG